MTEDEMVGWHHRLDGHEFEQAPGVGDGQVSLMCCRPWGCKVSDMTEPEKYSTMERFGVGSNPAEQAHVSCLGGCVVTAGW